MRKRRNELRKEKRDSPQQLVSPVGVMKRKDNKHKGDRWERNTVDEMQEESREYKESKSATALLVLARLFGRPIAMTKPTKEGKRPWSVTSTLLKLREASVCVCV